MLKSLSLIVTSKDPNVMVMSIAVAQAVTKETTPESATRDLHGVAGIYSRYSQ